MPVHKAVAFADGSRIFGHGTAAVALKSSDASNYGETLGIMAISFKKGNVTAGCMELCGICVSMDMALRLTETFPDGDTLWLTAWCDNEIVLEMCVDATVAESCGLTHLTPLLHCIEQRKAEFRRGGHRSEFRVPRHRRRSRFIREVDRLAHNVREARRNCPASQIPEDVYGALRISAEILENARRIDLDVYEKMLRH